MLLISFFIIITRALELLIKPIVAIASDNHKGKYGRRKPFILSGFIFYSILLVLLFYPPTNTLETLNNNLLNKKSEIEESNIRVSLWFGVLYLLFFVFDTICNIPYSALAPEMSDNPQEREKIYMIYYMFQYLGILFAVSAPVIFQIFLYNNCDLTVCDAYKDKFTQYYDCINEEQLICNNRNNLFSLRLISLILASNYIISIILMSIFLKEKDIGDNIKESSLSSSLNQYLNNKPFLSIVYPYIIDNVILSIFATMLPFYIQYVINPEEICALNGINLKSDECNSNIL